MNAPIYFWKHDGETVCVVIPLDLKQLGGIGALGECYMFELNRSPESRLPNGEKVKPIRSTTIFLVRDDMQAALEDDLILKGYTKSVPKLQVNVPDNAHLQ